MFNWILILPWECIILHILFTLVTLSYLNCLRVTQQSFLLLLQTLFLQNHGKEQQFSFKEHVILSSWLFCPRHCLFTPWSFSLCFLRITVLDSILFYTSTSATIFYDSHGDNPSKNLASFDQLVHLQCLYLLFRLTCPLLCLDVQLCPTLCDPKDCSPPSSSVYGDSPGKKLEWVAMPSSGGSSQPRVSHYA